MNFNKHCKLASNLQHPLRRLGLNGQCPSTVHTDDLEGQFGFKGQCPSSQGDLKGYWRPPIAVWIKKWRPICNVLCVEVASKVNAPPQSTQMTLKVELASKFNALPHRGGLEGYCPQFDLMSNSNVLKLIVLDLAVCRLTTIKSVIFFQMQSAKARRTDTVANQYQCKNVIFVQPWQILVCETWSKCKTYFYQHSE